MSDQSGWWSNRKLGAGLGYFRARAGFRCACVSILLVAQYPRPSVCLSYFDHYLCSQFQEGGCLSHVWNQSVSSKTFSVH